MARFVIYQVTNELRRHANKPELFPRADSEYFLQNVPPMFITVFHKDAKASLSVNGNSNGSNGSHARDGQRRTGKNRTQSVAPTR